MEILRETREFPLYPWFTLCSRQEQPFDSSCVSTSNTSEPYKYFSTESLWSCFCRQAFCWFDAMFPPKDDLKSNRRDTDDTEWEKMLVAAVLVFATKAAAVGLFYLFSDKSFQFFYWS